ncbi:14200_t:CDS:2 [Dentiscutata heterogama]|uniref:14200_t:CDS:1 n=1 Tax=Dentiscutata heterogama TaxID=1316150 RepID=A0ACA9L9P6_9GLOM|nr:14200_t:CDS:2 [Dentiscutata heterogama]
MQNEEWKIVSKRTAVKPARISPTIKKKHNFQYLNKDSKKKDRSKNTMQNSSENRNQSKKLFVSEIIDFQLLPPNRPALVDIVCYGIGSIEKSITSQYQFALMLLFKNLFQITGKIYAYDPILSQVDTEVLTHYNIESIKINEKAKRVVTNQTLFYMPHCPLGLYNNLIEANWDRIKLKDIIIVGNRLDFYNERMITASLERKAPYIIPISFLMATACISCVFYALKILQIHLFPSTTIQSPAIPDNTFNDLCWQWFPIDRIDSYKEDSEFWTLKRESNEDPEII